MRIHNLISQWSRSFILMSQHDLALAEAERKSVAQTVSLRIKLTVERARGLGMTPSHDNNYLLESLAPNSRRSSS
jgi:hypothetical protein